MKNDSIMALPSDPNDPEDRDVSVAGLERGMLARDLRRLRTRLGLNLAEFAERYGIPEGEYAGYESVRVAPPAAVMAYLRVIVAEPEAAARAVRQAA
ncbi:MAG: helix-turn-helix domain-containing protein [Sandarakinorhabdus sp.]